ncbi:unnamed protein product [Ranitomeya imitator]|uniref:Transposase Tc1-like domain-containing protein n=1 Tax=Ranitomeya imitator TaxID=111125 RepID=A0ABN9LIH6_9NEOB|nr:unnamed protein product [Ranitomeya imitator]
MKVSQSEKLSPSAVAKTIKRYKETGSHEDRPRKGRPRVTSASEDKFIRVTSLRNHRLTAAQIRDQVNATQSSSTRHTSTTTVKRRLCAAGLYGKIAARKPLLRTGNKQKRVVWAEEHKEWTLDQWKSVLWSDESKFEIFGSNHRVFVRRRKGERMDSTCLVPTVKHGGVFAQRYALILKKRSLVESGLSWHSESEERGPRRMEYDSGSLKSEHGSSRWRRDKNDDTPKSDVKKPVSLGQPLRKGKNPPVGVTSPITQTGQTVSKGAKPEQKATDKCKLTIKTAGLQRSSSDAGRDPRSPDAKKPPSGIARPGSTFGYKKPIAPSSPLTGAIKSWRRGRLGVNQTDREKEKAKAKAVAQDTECRTNTKNEVEVNVKEAAQTTPQRAITKPFMKTPTLSNLDKVNSNSLDFTPSVPELPNKQLDFPTSVACLTPSPAPILNINSASFSQGLSNLRMYPKLSGLHRSMESLPLTISVPPAQYAGDGNDQTPDTGWNDGNLKSPAPESAVQDRNTLPKKGLRYQSHSQDEPKERRHSHTIGGIQDSDDLSPLPPPLPLTNVGKPHLACLGEFVT